MSYDVGNFRILTGLVQVENDTNLHGYLDVGFRVDYLDTAGYNTTRQWIERQTAPATATTEATWEAISFEYGFGIPAATAGGPGYIVSHPGGGTEFYVVYNSFSFS